MPRQRIDHSRTPPASPRTSPSASCSSKEESDLPTGQTIASLEADERQIQEFQEEIRRLRGE